jgi:hypothetical protein
MALKKKNKLIIPAYAHPLFGRNIIVESRGKSKLIDIWKLNPTDDGEHIFMTTPWLFRRGDDATFISVKRTEDI